jgi:hypothetical protein
VRPTRAVWIDDFPFFVETYVLKVEDDRVEMACRSPVSLRADILTRTERNALGGHRR